MRILVVGGAGYIGSHMVSYLARQDVEVTVLDDLSSGHRDAIRKADLVEGTLADQNFLRGVFSRQPIDLVMHFASFIQVGESVREPAKYYRNNVTNTLNLLEVMREFGVSKFVFSSTAAVFGNPIRVPIDERHPRAPINPYGRTKAMVEDLLADFDSAYGLKSVCLRYFNAAGAYPKENLGERHDPETHLIPLVLQAASGRKAHITVFGRDYDTPDGTCIRDYIHVMDLAKAHWLAVEHLFAGKGSDAFNLGNGNGFSIQNVIDTVERVTGRPVPVLNGLRREGDPPRLVADSSRAREKLGWQPEHPDLETIIAHAWTWEARQAGLSKQKWLGQSGQQG